MANETKRTTDDGRNRCRRCNRPLSDPNDIYGWRCAQIVGLDKYLEIASVLVEDALKEYNAYVATYVQEGKETETEHANDEKESFLRKLPFFRPTDWRVASEIITRNATARMLEDEGYIQKTTLLDTYEEWHGNNFVNREIWHAPAYGYVAGTRDKAIAHRLTVESENVNYVAAYLRYFQDRWKDVYPEIDGRTAVLATLYNQDEARPPHSNPEPRPFGIQAKKEYPYMRQLLGLEEE